MRHSGDDASCATPLRAISLRLQHRRRVDRQSGSGRRCGGRSRCSPLALQWDDVGHDGPLSGSQIEFAHVNDHDECDDEDDHLHLSDLLCPLKHSCQQFIEPPLQPLGIACARRPVAENLGVLFQDIHAPRRVGHQRREELELQIRLCPRERERGLAPILRLNGSEDLKGELEARAESADALGKLCEHEGCPSCA